MAGSGGRAPLGVGAEPERGGAAVGGAGDGTLVAGGAIAGGEATARVGPSGKRDPLSGVAPRSWDGPVASAPDRGIVAPRAGRWRSTAVADGGAAPTSGRLSGASADRAAGAETAGVDTAVDAGKEAAGAAAGAGATGGTEGGGLVAGGADGATGNAASGVRAGDGTAGAIAMRSWPSTAGRAVVLQNHPMTPAFRTSAPATIQGHSRRGARGVASGTVWRVGTRAR